MKSSEMKKLEDAMKTPFPWGKGWKGEPMDSVPSSMLKWTAEKFDNNEIAEKADLIWRWREENKEHFEE